jgi:hypothetical protein
MLYQKSPIPTHPHTPTHPLPLFGPGVPLYWGDNIFKVVRSAPINISKE